MTADVPFADERRRALARIARTAPLVPGLVSRWLAFLVDIVVMTVAAMCATYLITWTAEFFRLGRLAIGQRIVSIVSRAAIIMVWSLYFPLSWTLTGQSPGKALLGLRVVRNDPRHPATTRLSFVRSALRAASYWLSAIPLGLGFLSAALDEEHKALHDRIAGTRVIYQPTMRRRRHP